MSLVYVLRSDHVTAPKLLNPADRRDVSQPRVTICGIVSAPSRLVPDGPATAATVQPL
jgi:hypothetical protein